MERRYLKMIRGMKSRKREPRDWSVYILLCGDGTFYTGVAKGVEARVAKHNSGRGAAYTRSRRPVNLLYREDGKTRSEALVREAAIKALPRAGKEALVRGGSSPGAVRRGASARRPLPSA